MTRVFVSGQKLLSCAGRSLVELRKAWVLANSQLSFENGRFVGRIATEIKSEIEKAFAHDPKYRRLDFVTKLGLWISRETLVSLPNKKREEYGVIFATSRGPTASLEQAVVSHAGGQPPKPTTSPITTFGSSAAVIAKRFDLLGPHLAISTACTSSLQAIGIAYELIKARSIPGILTTGAEAANTAFFMDTLDSTKVTSKAEVGDEFPQKPFHKLRSGMVLSEGAGSLVIDRLPDAAEAEIIGYGAATDSAGLASVSPDAMGLQKAMAKAIATADGTTKNDIDLVVMHGAGTQKGDEAELAAVTQFFVDRMPTLTANKWLYGHMLGAAGIAGVILGIEHAMGRLEVGLPYENIIPQTKQNKSDYKTVMVLALGFGGSSAALILRRC